MKFNIAICDDDVKWIEREKEYFNRLKGIKAEWSVFNCGEELISVYQKKGCIYDAIFLDMEMGNLDGINTANIIREIDKHVIIVFVTSHRKYMQESFECRPFRFLVKPVEFDEFKNVVLKVMESLEEDKKAFVFTEERNTIRLLYEEILFIQSVNHCIYVRTSNKTHKTYGSTMAQIKKQLSENLFIQVHKSYIVNMSYINEISRKEIRLRGYSHAIPLSDTYRDEVRRTAMLFEERKYLS